MNMRIIWTMNAFIWINIIFTQFCYSLAPQLSPDMMSILQELESHQAIKDFPQDKIAHIQITELRKAHHISPLKPVFSMNFLKEIKTITKRLNDNHQHLPSPTSFTPLDAQRYQELCQTIIELTIKLEQEPFNDIQAFYLKRALDSLIYIATPYNCYEEKVYKQNFRYLLFFIQKHPFWKKINPLKIKHPLPLIPVIQKSIKDALFEGEYNPLLIHQNPQKKAPLHHRKYDTLIPCSLHGTSLIKANQRTSLPFLTYYAQDELLFPFQADEFIRIARIHYAHEAVVILKILESLPLKQRPQRILFISCRIGLVNHNALISGIDAISWCLSQLLDKDHPPLEIWGILSNRLIGDSFFKSYIDPPLYG